MEDMIDIDLSICTTQVREALDRTAEQARMNRYEFITPEVLLYNIVIQPEFIKFCRDNNVDWDGLESELTAYNASQDRVPQNEDYHTVASLEMAHLFSLINQEQKIYREFENGNDCFFYVGIPEILRQMYSLDEESMARYLLCKYLGENDQSWDIPLHCAYIDGEIKDFPGNKGMSNADTEDNTDGTDIDVDELSQEELFQKMMNSANRLMGALHSLGQMGVGTDSDQEQEQEQKKEPWEELVTCLNTMHHFKNPLIGREKELERCIRILCRKDKNNPLFIGEPGVGKTALIYGLTRMIHYKEVPEWMQGYKVYALDTTTLVAGSSYHGEFEKRMKMVLEGARRHAQCIIYIDDIHTLCETGGGSQSMNAGEILKPYLEDPHIRFIGTTTYHDYNKSIAGKKAIARRFAQIDVKEPSVEETLQIIQGLQHNYEIFHEVKYAEEAVRYAVEQADRLIHDRFLPDKAIDLIDEAGAYLQQNPKLNKNGKPKQSRYQIVDIDIIKHILTDVCRIDAKALSSESNTELKDLAQRMSNDIYGQDEAIRQVVRSVMMSKAELTEPDKPIASLLFVGPTGVGKTEVCKVLARELGVELVRFDMSEYTEKHTISKLIGSPAGYVGYDEGGLLTDAIRKTPNCVLLLDEIEKAHGDIYNILLQVMDYARLTDNKGNKADFRNVILVMTSNAGAQFASQSGIGFASSQTKGQAMLGSVRKTFKPEFLNRLSGTVVFNDMDRKMATLILEKKLGQLAMRLKAKQVTLELNADAKEFLLEKGYNTQYGAREMDRAIQQHLTPLLMEEILFGKLRNGGKAIVEKADNGSLFFNHY